MVSPRTAIMVVTLRTHRVECPERPVEVLGRLSVCSACPQNGPMSSDTHPEFTVTAIQAGGPARRGRADAGVRSPHRPPAGPGARRHRADRAPPGGGRHGPPAGAADRSGPRPLEHRPGRQHPPPLRPLRRQPPLRGPPDPRAAARAGGRADAAGLHDPRVGRRSRRRPTCRSTGSSSCSPAFGSCRLRATPDGSQVVVVGTGDHPPAVVCGDNFLPLWHGELDEPTTEGQRLVLGLEPAEVWLAHEREPWRPTGR